jgi:hypothetical protein
MRNLTGECTFVLDRQVTGLCDVFVEYAGRFPERGEPQHLLHFGTALKIAKRQQIDIHVGVGLSCRCGPFHRDWLFVQISGVAALGVS